ncbi:MAG: hypothetical protein JXR64_04975 [Spirochaetales bacterium]|nr:hypothetical protein [Spirochaetales bacterium]
MFLIWLILISFILISTVVYTVARYKNQFIVLRIVQPLTTLLFVILASVGTLRYGMHHTYTMLIMLALTFALAGDCNLIELKKNKYFLIAILFYWLGLVSYSTTFTIFQGVSKASLILFPILIVITLITIKKFFWEGMKKNNMVAAILIYCLAWCYLLSITLTLCFNSTLLLSTLQKVLIMLGTGLYFLGDLNLSFHKFNEKFENKPYWLGALLYCIGQTLVALSASLFTIYNI